MNTVARISKRSVEVKWINTSKEQMKGSNQITRNDVLIKYIIKAFYKNINISTWERRKRGISQETIFVKWIGKVLKPIDHVNKPTQNRKKKFFVKHNILKINSDRLRKTFFFHGAVC